MPISQFAILPKWALLKSVFLQHFSIFLPEIFRMRIKVHCALKMGAVFLFRPQKKFGGQISAFSPALCIYILVSDLFLFDRGKLFIDGTSIFPFFVYFSVKVFMGDFGT